MSPEDLSICTYVLALWAIAALVNPQSIPLHMSNRIIEWLNTVNMSLFSLFLNFFCTGKVFTSHHEGKDFLSFIKPEFLKNPKQTNNKKTHLTSDGF